MSTTEAQTAGKRSSAATRAFSVAKTSRHSPALMFIELSGRQIVLDDLYRSPIADEWPSAWGGEVWPTDVIRRQARRSCPDDGDLETKLQTLINEVTELREEVASLREIMTLPALSVSEQQQRHVELFEEFIRLAAQWQAETAGASVARRIVSHPAYLRIIGMGDRAVPWILDQLENGEAHWFEALHAITGANPVPDEDRGVYAKMTQAWLTWGRDNGWIV